MGPLLSTVPVGCSTEENVGQAAATEDEHDRNDRDRTRVGYGEILAASATRVPRAVVYQSLVPATGDGGGRSRRAQPRPGQAGPVWPVRESAAAT